MHCFFINRPAPSQPQYFSPNYAIRDGRWKLLMNGDGSALELYDLVADAAETRNLARDSARIAARLAEGVRAWRGTLPEDIEYAAIPKNVKPL